MSFGDETSEPAPKRTLWLCRRCSQHVSVEVTRSPLIVVREAVERGNTTSIHSPCGGDPGAVGVLDLVGSVATVTAADALAASLRSQ